jgi:hypothetical protein
MTVIAIRFPGILRVGASDPDFIRAHRCSSAVG